VARETFCCRPKILRRRQNRTELGKERAVRQSISKVEPHNSVRTRPFEPLQNLPPSELRSDCCNERPTATFAGPFKTATVPAGIFRRRVAKLSDRLGQSGGRPSPVRVVPPVLQAGRPAAAGVRAGAAEVSADLEPAGPCRWSGRSHTCRGWTVRPAKSKLGSHTSGRIDPFGVVCKIRPLSGFPPVPLGRAEAAGRSGRKGTGSCEQPLARSEANRVRTQLSVGLSSEPSVDHERRSAGKGPSKGVLEP